VLTAFSVSLLPLNFGAFQVLLTPDLLLLATLHAGDWSVAAARAVGVLLACGLAVVGVWFLWPSPERRRFPETAAEALRADGHYLRKVAEGHGREAPEVDAARKHFGLALLAAEASFQRLMAEYRGPPQQLEPAMAVITYSRRLAMSVSALGEDPAAANDPGAPVQELAHKASDTLEALADSLKTGRTPPPVPPLPACGGIEDPVCDSLLERVPRQLGVLHHAVSRLGSFAEMR
jgi:uncharacterized membrane protein YccC